MWTWEGAGYLARRSRPPSFLISAICSAQVAPEEIREYAPSIPRCSAGARASFSSGPVSSARTAPGWSLLVRAPA